MVNTTNNSLEMALINQELCLLAVSGYRKFSRVSILEITTIMSGIVGSLVTWFVCFLRSARCVCDRLGLRIRIVAFS